MENVSAQLQPATAGHARLVLSKTVLFSAQACTHTHLSSILPKWGSPPLGIRNDKRQASLPPRPSGTVLVYSPNPPFTYIISDQCVSKIVNTQVGNQLEREVTDKRG